MTRGKAWNGLRRRQPTDVNDHPPVQVEDGPFQRGGSEVEAEVTHAQYRWATTFWYAGSTSSVVRRSPWLRIGPPFPWMPGQTPTRHFTGGCRLSARSG